MVAERGSLYFVLRKKVCPSSTAVWTFSVPETQEGQGEPGARRRRSWGSEVESLIFEEKSRGRCATKSFVVFLRILGI